MKKINYIFIFFTFFTSLNFAQLTIKDQESSPNTLLQVVDEGTSGSVILPPLSTITDPAGKLYNLGNVLYWGTTALGSSGSAGGWTNTTGKIYNTTLSDKIGIGTNNPLSVLHLKTQDNWNPSSGNGWGDFSLSDGTKGLAIGMAVGGGGAGDIRIWAKGGTERIMLGDATNGEVLTTFDGKVGIGISSPTAKLEVAGQIKITGGSPGDGKVLTSNSDGLATWEINDIPQIGFFAYPLSPLSFASNTTVVLSNLVESFDDGNGFNPTTGEYTIPSQGLYHFIMKVHWRELAAAPNDGSVKMYFYKNGNSVETLIQKINLTSNTDYVGVNMSAIMFANTGDKITFRTSYTSTASFYVEGAAPHLTNVSGYKIY